MTRPVRVALVASAAALVAGVAAVLAIAAAVDARADPGAAILLALVAVWLSQAIGALYRTNRPRRTP